MAMCLVLLDGQPVHRRALGATRAIATVATPMAAR
jgi:hypothetical protein